MLVVRQTFTKFFMLVLILVFSTGCARPQNGTGSSPVRLTFAAYTAPREAYSEIIELFKQQWVEKTGQEVIFEQAYQSSGALSRAIVEGFEADITALALEADVARIEKAGLITHDWRNQPFGGMVCTSVVAFAVRPGNPKDIQDWADLIGPGVDILTPNPRTSGGAMWNILALYGAAYRGQVDGVPGGDEISAQAYLLSVLNHVTVMDKGARESIINFEKGIGDVAITYENEVLAGQRNGQQYDLVIPASTIRVDNPVVVVDVYAEKHGTRTVADAFVEFLYSSEAQAVFSRHGFRSPDPAGEDGAAALFPPVADLFTISQLGGWGSVTPKFFGQDGIYTLTMAQVQRKSP